MKVLYHLPILPPKLPQAEAFSQEIKALSEHFNGQLIYLNPNERSPIYIPRLLFGLHRWPEIRRREAEIDLHHIYNPDPFAYPILRWLRRPVVYTISGGVGERPPNLDFFKAMGAVTVFDELSLERLQHWGLRNAFLVHTGIETSQFTYTPLAPQPPIRLMMGSAPWTLAQFRSKGVDALLAAAQQSPQLHLIFLWRGVLAAEMTERVRRLHLQNQVTILDGLVDVNQVLATVHASIVLATEPNLVKAYPHSLLDSMAAGKPVLVSRAIPMAQYVEATGCGQIVAQVDATAILAAVDALMTNYAQAQSMAQRLGQQDFSQQSMIASYQRVYEQVLNAR
ncbi:hypothetical protein BH10CHL1_BH10CHL1_24570 [soil metagenome]